MKTASDIEIYMLGLINAERRAHGLKALVLERNLNESAEHYSELLLEEGHFGHTGPDGSIARERVAAARFDMSERWSIGENLAAGTLAGGDLRRDVERLHEDLMDSPGHRTNILKDGFTHVGIGIEIGDFDLLSGRPTMMITQNFGASSGRLDAQIAGSSRNDRLTGGTGDDLLDGGAGDDRLSGKGGRDTLIGADGEDAIYGGDGNDRLSGGDDSDRLYGGSGSDRISGGSGNDRVKAGSGNDIVHGGDGRDRIGGDQGNDRLYGDAGNDRIFGQSGNDRLYGGSGNDRLSGSSGKDWMKGGSGDDSLSGGSGNDALYGQSGRDRLDGGSGDDRLYGGDGADTFVFREGSGTDRIRDFDVKEDRLALDADLWSGRMTGGQVLRAFGEETDRGFELDFGSDHLILAGVDDLSDLYGRIDLI